MGIKNSRSCFSGRKSGACRHGGKWNCRRAVPCSHKGKQAGRSPYDGNAPSGLHLSEDIGRFWSLTGRTDYYSLYERTFTHFSADQEQSILRRLAKQVLNPPSAVLSAAIPVPGLAEALEQERDRWLREKKASMSPKELQALIRETEDFKKWSAQDKSCLDFLIQPEQLPEPEEDPPFFSGLRHGIFCCGSPSPLAGIGSYQLFF